MLCCYAHCHCQAPLQLQFNSISDGKALQIPVHVPDSTRQLTLTGDALRCAVLCCAACSRWPNQGMTGQLPAWVAELPVLQVLELSNNSFSGELPPAWFTEGAFPALLQLHLRNSESVTAGAAARMFCTYACAVLMFHLLLCIQHTPSSGTVLHAAPAIVYATRACCALLFLQTA